MGKANPTFPAFEFVPVPSLIAIENIAVGGVIDQTQSANGLLDKSTVPG